MGAPCWINVYPPFNGGTPLYFYGAKHGSRELADQAVSRLRPRLYVIRCTPKKGRA